MIFLQLSVQPPSGILAGHKMRIMLFSCVLFHHLFSSNHLISRILIGKKGTNYVAFNFIHFLSLSPSLLP
jgi:hypothetical protein